MKSFVLSLLMLVTINLANAQHSDPSQVSAEKQNRWISETTRVLRNFSPDSTIAPVTIDKYVWENGQKISCRVIKSGIIRLENGSWIYITTTSSHENQEIGDVSMAVDDKKNIYKNMGHVCAGIIHFETTQLTELKNTADFFKYFVNDTDDAGWEKVNF